MLIALSEETQSCFFKNNILFIFVLVDLLQHTECHHLHEFDTPTSRVFVLPPTCFPLSLQPNHLSPPLAPPFPSLPMVAVPSMPIMAVEQVAPCRWSRINPCKDFTSLGNPFNVAS